MKARSRDKNGIRPGNLAQVSRWLSAQGWQNLLVIAALLAIYYPAWTGQPIWDDEGHLTRQDLRSFDGLWRIWTKPGASQQYYPLVHSVFWLEYHLWGERTLGYHLINILLHACSVLLLWKILRRLGVSGGWLAALVFAVHPVLVESVAWIAELKNTLSGFLYLSAALVYLSFDQHRNRRAYFCAFGLFTLGLMAKSVIATLPAALLIIFWWKRGRLSWKKDIWPLVPFFSIGIAAGLFTAWMERFFIGAAGSEFDFSFVERCLIAGRAFWFYLAKLLWPANLSFIYPRWDIDPAVWWQYLFPAAALLLLVIACRMARSNRGPLAALLYFVVTLSPALGFINVYPFRYSFVADHFQYLACLGPITLVAAWMCCSTKPSTGSMSLPKSAFLTLLLLALSVLTWRQSAMFSDIETLYQTTIHRNPACWMAYNNLGAFYLENGDVDKALFNYQKALDLHPDYPEENNLSMALLRKGQVNDAILHGRNALRLKPDSPEILLHLGDALFTKGLLDEAISDYQKASEFQPGSVTIQNNLGLALFNRNRVDEAIFHYRAALALESGSAESHNNLGLALFQKGQLDEAIAHYRKAVQIKPIFPEAQANLGNALLQQGHPEEALPFYKNALKLDPENSGVQNNLAWILATSPQASLRNGPEAVKLAEQAARLTGGANPAVLHTLACAYAESGRFDEAIGMAGRALRLARTQGNADLANLIQASISGYQKGFPVRENP